MKLKMLPIFTVLVLLLASCSSSTLPKLEVTSYSEETLETKIPLNLNVDCENGSIEIYSWSRNAIGLEITKIVRGNETRASLLKSLEKFKIDISNEGSRVGLKTRFEGKGKIEGLVGLKLYIPKKTSSFTLQQNDGSLVMFDDFNGTIDVNAKRLDLDINRLEGKLICRLDRGDLRVSAGFIESTSSVSTGNGNIRIKASFENSGSYDFKTGFGILELSVPKDTNAVFDTYGLLDGNDFIEGDNPSTFRLESKAGRIRILKF